MDRPHAAFPNRRELRVPPLGGAAQLRGGPRSSGPLRRERLQFTGEGTVQVEGTNEFLPAVRMLTFELFGPDRFTGIQTRHEIG